MIAQATGALPVGRGALALHRSSRANAQTLADLSSRLGRCSVDEATELVAYCRVTEAFKEGASKIQLAVREAESEKAVVDGLVQLGGLKKTGVAPMGHLERMLQTAVDKDGRI